METCFKMQNMKHEMVQTAYTVLSKTLWRHRDPILIGKDIFYDKHVHPLQTGVG